MLSWHSLWKRGQWRTDGFWCGQRHWFPSYAWISACPTQSALSHVSIWGRNCTFHIRSYFDRPVVHNRGCWVIFSRQESLSFSSWAHLSGPGIILFCDWLCCKWSPQRLHRGSLNICLCFRTAFRSHFNAWSSHNRSPAPVFQLWQNVVFDSNLSFIGRVTTLKRRSWTLYSSLLA